MWVLVIMLVASTPSTTKLNSGSLRAVMPSKEECLKAKEHVDKTWKFTNHRVSSSCGYFGHL